MADVEEDRISIVIEADSGGASRAFDAVMGRLDDLEARVSSVGGALDSFGSGLADRIGPALSALESLSDAGGALDGIGDKLRGLADGIGSLSRVDAAQAEQAGRSVTELAHGIGSLEDVDAERLGALANGLSAIPEAVRGMSGASTESIADLRGKLDSLASSAERASKVGNGIAGLAQGLRGIPAGLKGFESIDGLDGKMQNLDIVLGRLKDSLSVFDRAARANATAVKNIADGLGRLSRMGEDAESLADNLESLSGALGRFARASAQQVTDRDAAKFYAMADAVDKLTQSYQRMAQAQRAASQRGQAQRALPAGQEQEQARPAARGRGGAIGTAALSAVQAAGSKAGAVLSKAWSAATSAAERYASVMSRVVSMPIDSVRSRIDGVAHSLSRLASMAASAVFYNSLFAGLRAAVDGVTTGIQNLYQWALIMGNGFVGTMDSCATSLLYFQNSIGAAASSLLDALAPAFETVINYAVAAINAVNQLLAALTGHGTWRRARRAQTSFAAAATDAGGASEDAADSAEDNAAATDDATKAAKQYENTVMGFDELNKLNAEPEDSSSKAKTPKSKKAKTPKAGGGGAAVPDYGSMFEEVPVDDYFKDLANTDDWTKLGEDIANALNDWERNIDWDAIDRTAAKWSKRIWTAFNGFVHARDWSLFGYTIGRGINVGLHFIDDIAQNADFTYFGAGIAGALNKAVETIDWPALGRVMTDGAKVSLEFLHGFLRGNEAYEGFNFDRLRDKLNEAIDAAFGNINWQMAVDDVTYGVAQVGITFLSAISRIAVDIDDAIQNTDWVGWGADVAGYLKQAVDTIDWPGLGRLLTDGLKIMFEGLHGFLDESEANGFWTDLGNGIESGITSAFNNVDWSQAGMDVNRLANHLLDVIEQAIGAINWDDVNAFIVGLDIPQLLLRALGDIARGIGDLLVNSLENGTWPLIVAWLAGKAAPLALKIAKLLLEIKHDKAIADAARGIGDTIGKGISDSAGQAVENGGLGGKIAQWLTEHVGAGGTTTAASSAGSAIGLALGGAIGLGIGFDGINRQVNDGISALGAGETIGGATLAGASIGGAFGGPMGAAIGAAIGAASGAIAEFGTYVYQKRDEIGDALSQTWDGFKQSVSEVPDKVKGAFDSAGQHISEFVDGIGEKFSGVPDKIGAAFGGVPQKVGDALGGLLEKVRGAFEPTVAYAEEAGEDTGDSYSSGVSSKGDDAQASGQSLGERARAGILPYVSDATNWGTDTGNNLAGGIDGTRGTVSLTATETGNDVMRGITDVTSGAHSWGTDTSENLAGGIDDRSGSAERSAQQTAQMVQNAIANGAVNPATGWGGDTSSNYGTGISNNQGWVSGAVSGIGGIVSSAMNIGGQAYSWGRDLMYNFTQAIYNTTVWVRDAVVNVAGVIASYLHFSEPDMGPLSDFHTYAPDMMREFAAGVERYSSLVTDSVSAVAGDMSATIRYDVDTSQAGSLIANAVTLGVVGSRGTQQAQSDQRPINLVLRIGNEDIARATYRGIDSLADRGVITPQFV